METAEQRVTGGISDNFVPAPKHSAALEDLLMGLKRFRNSVRWKWFFLEIKKKDSEKRNLSHRHTTHIQQSNVVIDSQNLEERSNSVAPNPILPDGNNLGLATGVRPKQKFTQAPQASIEVEAFIWDVELSLLGNTEMNPERPRLTGSKRLLNGEITSLKVILDDAPDVVVVPTDKTNSYRVLATSKYISWVGNILAADAKEVSKEDLGRIYAVCKTKLQNLKDLLNKDEFGFIKETIKSKKFQVLPC
jgi:hypothetical protein